MKSIHLVQKLYEILIFKMITRSRGFLGSCAV